MKLKKEKIMDDLFSLKNKKVLITGASSGIGSEIAIQTALKDADVILLARNKERLNAVSQTIRNKNNKIPQCFVCDLTSKDDLDKLVNDLEPIDGLVLNAGAVKLAPVAFIKDNILDELFELNIKSSIRLLQRLIKYKKIKKGASIVFISSIATQKATIGNAVYNSSKGAVNSFVKSLALETASKQIRVNAVLPGFVPTAILCEDKISNEELENHKKNYPLGRFGKPEDIAYLSIYLLSDASQWMTGALINLDGGFSLK